MSARRPRDKKNRNTVSTGKTKSGLHWRRYLLALLLLPLLLLGVYVVYLQAQMAQKMASSRWREAATVYARPLHLAVNAYVMQNDVLRELQWLGYREVDGIQNSGEFQRGEQLWRIAVRAVNTPLLSQKPQLLQLQWNKQQLHALSDERGRSLVEAWLDPLLLARWQPQGREDRELVKLSEVPPELLAALIETEDKSFYTHAGFSLRAIARALWQNLRSGETLQGGSTLTQQLVKNYFLSSERSLWRKFNELLMAIVLEWKFDKDDILEAYLNEVYFGQDGDRAIHGVGLASRFFFAKPVNELSVAESALLVGLVKGPSYYSPLRYPQRAKERRDLVLSLLAEAGKLDSKSLQHWQQQALLPAQRADSLSAQAPALIDALRKEWPQRLKAVSLQQSGLRVYTSIDPVLQQKAQQSVSEMLDRLDPEHRLQAAMVITDRRTGLLQALVGERDGRSGYNRALSAQRAVGSSLKPMIVYSALQRPQLFTLATPLQDSTFVMRAEDGREWQPKNYDGRQHGLVPLRDVLAQSYNLATARMAMEIGLKSLQREWAVMGLKKDYALVPSLALGALELSPLELSAMYSGLASGGPVFPVRMLQGYSNGEESQRLPNTAQAQLDARAVYLTVSAMQEVVNTGTAKKLGALFPGRKIAAKTGTTNDKRDAWFSAIDERYLVVIWIGRDDNKPTPYTGANGALPVYLRLQSLLPDTQLELAVPKGIAYAHLAMRDGLMLQGECEAALRLPADERTPMRACEAENEETEAAEEN